MRVLHLISSGGYYGAESMLLNLIGGDEMALSQTVLAVFHNRHRPNTELYHRAVAMGVRAELVDCQGRLDWGAVGRVRRLIRTGGVELIHTHGYKADLYGYAAGRLEGRPLVATCHNWLAGGAMLAVYNSLDRLVLRRFDAVGAVSPAVAEKLLSHGVNRDRVKLIPNGIDLHAFDRGFPAGDPGTPARGEKVVGIVARLDLQKGFEHLLRAIRTLRASFSGLRLLIVGEGPDREKIEALVAGMGLNSAVTMAGHRSDMAAVYSSIDIFVLPSFNEGLPMTLLEAMAASKPIVATKVGAVPTVIANGRNGLLVDPGDEAALTQAIGQLLGDPDARRRMGENARLHAEQNYTAAATIERYRELYRTVAARRAGHRPQAVSTLAAAGSGPASAKETCAPKS